MSDDLMKLLWVAQNFPHSTDCRRDDPDGEQANPCLKCVANHSVGDVAEMASEAWLALTKRLENQP